jgi:hypothetical protein
MYPEFFDIAGFDAGVKRRGFAMEWEIPIITPIVHDSLQGAGAPCGGGISPDPGGCTSGSSAMECFSGGSGN